MQADTRRFFGAALLLGAVFCAVYVRVAYPPPPELKPERQWGAPRLLVSDSVLYGFVRELLAQSSSGILPEGMAHADFYISRTLVEHSLTPAVGYFPYRYAAQEDGWTLQELCNRRLLAPADTAYMRLQMKYSAGFGLEQRFLPNHRVIPADTLRALRTREKYLDKFWKKLYAQYLLEEISYLTCPLFSRDGKTVIVGVTTNCRGLCGGGDTWVLKRHQGKWRIAWLLNSWVS
ncbi:hypothetical protein [Hymenobacter yonginensis]|uniref:Uncharacterized protein n=1 Tax=Hymenobacter yonginensis TaxID=748197 RepID=A0ABY7PKS7_9BACT|nr:hypothetical protein [Hymenobacter yonginensis]WBO83396.1 hypothetical protein O9Z63_13505 [Hymenobacter yonginensis]